MDVDIALNFNGRCEAAINFYRHAIEADCIHLTRFADSPSDKIFHATIAVGCTRIMASDVGCVGDGDNQNQPPFTGFALALRADDVQQAQQFLDRLADGGSVLMPMTETFFAQRYAIVTDPFGVTWKVMLEKEIS
jgi:PhnB protein